MYDRREAAVIAPQKLKQVRESIKLVNSTLSPEIYFSRYDFTVECMKELSKCQKHVKFSGELPSLGLQRFQCEEQRIASINSFLDRAEKRVAEKIKSLKIDKEKRNAVEVFKDELSKYQNRFYPENESYYAAKLKKLEKMIPAEEHKNAGTKRVQSQNVLQRANEREADKVLIIVKSQNASSAERTQISTIAAERGAWTISVSFENTTSKSIDAAVFLAKQAPKYEQTEYNGKMIHQAFYGSAPKEYLAFVQLYEMVSKWKTSVAMINGIIVDRKIIGGLNYCYGDFCRNGRTRFCYGASEFTENPFGCHRLQISASNHPWYTFSRKSGSVYYVNKNAIRARIDEFATAYRMCPKFDYECVMKELEKLPDRITEQQMQTLNPYGAYALQSDNEIQLSGISER